MKVNSSTSYFEIPGKIRRQLWLLKFRHGTLGWWLRDFKRSNEVIVNTNELADRIFWIANKRGKVLAWAMLKKRTWADAKFPYEVGFYTQKKYRRKGYGTSIYKSIEKTVGNNIRVYPHDTISTEFFKSVGF